MFMTLEKVTLDVKVGVRLAVRRDGVIEIAPDAGPVPSRTNGATAPAPEEPRQDATKKAAVAAKETVDRVIEALTRIPDPYKWRTYSEMMCLVYPGVEHRDGPYPSHQYNILNMALKRLRDHGLDVRRVERSDGLESRRHLYRLHKEPEPRPETSAMPETESYMHAGHG